MLCLEKFRSGLVLDLLFWLLDGNSMKTGKWSLISETSTPLLYDEDELFVRIWSMNEMDWL